MANADSSRSFKISEGPVTSSVAIPAIRELDELPAYHGEPLLLAIARNPRSLFICWSVDWPATFSNGIPADRSAHVKIRSGVEQAKTVAVEPMAASCLVDELEPGAIYSVELGYYAPPDNWHTVARGNEVMMPLDEPRIGEQPVDVATVPLHLAFQRIADVLRAESGENIVEALAQVEKRATATLTARDSEVLQALGISAEDLRRTTAYREQLSGTPAVREGAENLFGFGGSSPSSGFGSGS